MPDTPTARCMLALVLTLVSARAVRAQPPAGPTMQKTVPAETSWTSAAAPDRRLATVPVRANQSQTGGPANVRLLAVGNFLGQFDGFCEPPGGPYDLMLSKALNRCHPGGPGGNVPANGAGVPAAADSPWPAALGGLIGAETWIDANLSKTRPAVRLLLQGNNQTPDFADVLAKDWPYRSPVTSRQRSNVHRRQQRAASASDLFWNRIARLRPRAVALGPDDFYRSLRLSSDARRAKTIDESDTSASRFVQWVRQKQDVVPFLASNTIVSVNARKLNTVKSGSRARRYELVLAEGSSVGWLKELAIKHPCGILSTFVLQSSPTGADPWREVPIAVGTPSKQAVDCQTTLKVEKGALQPGTYFRVRRVAPAADTFEEIGTFRTHAPLTPAGPSVAGLEGWPALLVPLVETTATTPTTGTPPAPDEMLIVSLVSQNTREALGTPVWSWEAVAAAAASSGRTATEPNVCAAGEHETTCRIDFLPPADALHAILEQVLTVRDRLPFIVLLSMMNDDDTLDVMERFPEIRVVVLPPDSLLLGRASRQTPTGAKDSLEARLAAQGRPTAMPDFSGDLGMIGILDADKASVARLIVRPEWVGETIADVDLQVRYETDEQQGSHWALRAPSPQLASVATVPGVPLVAGEGQPVDGFATAVYWPLGHESELKTEPYVTYLACVEADARPMCKAFKDVWTDAPTLLAVTADALRDRSRADIVVVPEDLADGDAVAWMEHALAKGDTSWLSAYILQRVTFRPYRFVRATIGGDKLLAMLQKVLDDPLGNGSTYCIAGLGEDLGCPSKLPTERLEKVRVNGRVLQPGFFYTVTMPDRLAEQQQLRHSDDREDGFDAIDALQESLNPVDPGKEPGSAGAWYPDAWEDDTEAPPSMIARLEEKATERPKHYINIAELEFGLINLDARAPDGGRQIPNNVDFDVRGARSYDSRSLAVKADSVVADFKRQAIRGIFELEYAKRSELDNEIVSYDRDRLLFGPRLDLWKVRTLGDLRPYVGYFWEGPMRQHVSELSASRSLGTVTRADGATLTQTESAGFKTRFTVSENLYKYGAAGADVVVSSMAFRRIPHLELALSRGKLEWARGRASRVPLDVLVDTDSGGPLAGVNLATIRAECPDKSASARSGDAAALLNAFFTCRPGDLAPDSRVELRTGRRGQDRTQFELEGVVAVKAWGRTFKVTLTNQLRAYKVRREDADPPRLDLAIDRTNRFKMQISIPVIWRLEFAPAYEHQYARIQAGDVFTVKRWDVKFKLPLFFGLSRPPFAG